MAKLGVFRAAVSAGLVPLAIFGVLTSAAGLYYYLNVVVYMYMRPAKGEAAIAPGRMATAAVALAGCAGLVIYMGVQPGGVAAVLGPALAAFGR
jgi:NADH-quinone oxidoreductase subunit N